MLTVFQMASEREGSGSGSSDSKPSGDEESKEKQEGKNWQSFRKIGNKYY